MKTFSSLFLALSLFAPVAGAQELTVIKTSDVKAAWLPDSAVTQHAGYAGYIAVGFGYEWRDTWTADLMYGYTPQELAGEVVHSWTLKSVAYLFSVGQREFVRARPYLGLSINYSPDDELFVRLPHQYPKGYYPATAIRPALVGGIEFRIQNQLAVGVEFAVLDSELAYFTDSKEFDPSQMGSSGLSVRWLL